MLPRQRQGERDYSFDSESRAYFMTDMDICLKMRKRLKTSKQPHKGAFAFISEVMYCKDIVDYL